MSKRGFTQWRQRSAQPIKGMGAFDAFGIDEAPLEAGNIKQLMLPCSLLLFATAGAIE